MNESLEILSSTSIQAKNNIRDINIEHVNQLAANMLENGIINPLTVRPEGDGYVLVAGHHRFEAALKAGITQIPTKIIYDSDSASASYISLSENIIRRDMTWPEQVAAIRMLKENNDIDNEIVAKKLSIHKGTAASMMIISELPQDYIEKGANNPPLRSEFKRYARLPDDRRSELLDNILTVAQNNNGKYPGAPKLEKAIDRLEIGLMNACFDTAECQTCPRNTACQTSMFADVNDSDGLCQDSKCYDAKSKEALADAVEKVQKEEAITDEKIINIESGTNIEESFTHNEIQFTPWSKNDLADAASGCNGCKDKIIASTRMTTRCLAQVVCANAECYKEMLPKNNAALIDSSNTTTNHENSNESATNTQDASKNKIKNETFKPEMKHDSNSIVKYRRSITEKTIATAVLDTKDAGVLLRCITILLSKKTNDTCFEKEDVDLNKINDLSPSKIQEVFRNFVLSNLKKMNHDTLFAIYNTTTCEDDLRELSTVLNDGFLQSLTRSELLSLMVEYEMDKDLDEKGWKKVLKNTKGQLIESIMTTEFDTQFLPSVLIPSNIQTLPVNL